MREPAGDLVARVSGITGQGTRYYHFDELGSTRLLTKENGAVTDEYNYDAWGNVTGHTGESAQPYQFVGQLGYCTHYQDSNLPLLQLGVRFYDPEMGRFTQVDPANEGMNWYAYVGCQPTISADPLGLEIMPPDAWCYSVGSPNSRERKKHCAAEKRDCIRGRNHWSWLNYQFRRWLCGPWPKYILQNLQDEVPDPKGTYWDDFGFSKQIARDCRAYELGAKLAGVDVEADCLRDARRKYQEDLRRDRKVCDDEYQSCVRAPSHEHCRI